MLPLGAHDLCITSPTDYAYQPLLTLGCFEIYSVAYMWYLFFHLLSSSVLSLATSFPSLIHSFSMNSPYYVALTLTTWYCFQMQSAKILAAITHYIKKKPSGTNCQDSPSLYQIFLGLYCICPSLGALLPHSIYHTPYPIVYHSWVIKVLRFLTGNNDLDLTSSPITWRQTLEGISLRFPCKLLIPDRVECILHSLSWSGDNFATCPLTCYVRHLCGGTQISIFLVFRTLTSMRQWLYLTSLPGKLNITTHASVSSNFYPWW